MEAMQFKRAFYLKLGRGGVWEKDSIDTRKLRFGWENQTLEDINSQRWELIKRQLQEEHRGNTKAVATQALHGIQIIAESDPDDVWITFYQARLWWTRVAPTPVERDSISQFRRTALPWNSTSAEGHPLIVNELPGQIAQLQGYKWTVCRVKCVELLRRILSGTQSDLAASIKSTRITLEQHLIKAIKELHPKDFETLVDLVFLHTGWNRVSVLGQVEKAYDLQLQEPITGDLYAVQVKSKAGKADLKTIIAELSADTFKRVFFVVHSPEADLVSAEDIPSYVQMVFPDKLAQLAVDAGLVTWLEKKAY